MRRVFHPETNGVKASPHRLKWMLSRGALAAPSDPWNFDASQPAGQDPDTRLASGTVTLPLCSRTNASPFWITLLLVLGGSEHGMIPAAPRSPHYGEHMWRWAHVVNDPTLRRSKTRRGFEE